MASTPALARSQSARRCKLCNNLDPRSHPATHRDQDSTSPPIAHLTLQLDPVRLKRSGQVCSRCRLLAQALDAHCHSWRNTRPCLLLHLVERAPVRLDVKDDGGNTEKLEIYAPADKPLAWPTLGRAPSVPKHSDSDASFAFVQRAIDDCLKNHQHRLCGQSRRDEFVPTRLIYVGKDPNSTKHLKLCQLPATRVRYLSLSHCWGGGPTFTTTKANLKDRKRHIDFSSMPQSFQDAVTIAQQLGVYYLWIDALCIIQDSKEDWELESAKMSSIYENAYLTIAATTAPNSDAGIFSARPRPAKLKYQSSARSKEYKLCVRGIPAHHHSKTLPTHPPSGPLRTRAWALQEHVLCSRILHYTHHELLFECRLTARCECRPPSRKLPQATTPRLLPNLLITGKKEAYWRTWHAIVQAYTKRELTVPGDKLPAVSGIAKALLRGKGEGGAGAYVCGLWRGNLVEDLLWTSVDGMRTPPERWRAPTWSWASVDGEVSYEWADPGAADGENEMFTKLIEVRHVHVKPSGRNPLGAVGEAWLMVEGPVVEAVLHAKLNERQEQGSNGPGVRYCILRLEKQNGAPDEQPMTVRRAKPGEEGMAFKANVLCLALARSESSWIAGIVLGAAERNGKTEYERLGAFGCGDEWLAGAKKKELVLL
ncbi:heterokaryon incompatibility protein-domain-containing protein [Macrophomina phaseolina]|uniref:Heterokaryon incompatibility protein-domain-containing protein n=1 Tax=Macrophomina phaseolina TaxID=35725 RepID=A0ABQ8G7H6_9PEZI|nr:heterokaryon incompatibility protein-domain-containing protein [Macrophomina phaseolina]